MFTYQLQEMCEDPDRHVPAHALIWDQGKEELCVVAGEVIPWRGSLYPMHVFPEKERNPGRGMCWFRTPGFGQNVPPDRGGRLERVGKSDVFANEVDAYAVMWQRYNSQAEKWAGKAAVAAGLMTNALMCMGVHMQKGEWPASKTPKTSEREHDWKTVGPDDERECAACGISAYPPRNTGSCPGERPATHQGVQMVQMRMINNELSRWTADFDCGHQVVLDLPARPDPFLRSFAADLKEVEPVLRAHHKGDYPGCRGKLVRR